MNTVRSRAFPISGPQAAMHTWITETWQIRIVKDNTFLQHRLLHDPSVLWMTHCSASKTSFPQRVPVHCRYNSGYIFSFIRFAREENVRFAILSDKFGCCFDGMYLPPYNVSPLELSTARRRELGRLVYTQCNTEGFTQVCFTALSVLTARPYLEILHYSGLSVFFTGNIPFIKERPKI